MVVMGSFPLLRLQTIYVSVSWVCPRSPTLSIYGSKPLPVTKLTAQEEASQAREQTNRLPQTHATGFVKRYFLSRVGGLFHLTQ